MAALVIAAIVVVPTAASAQAGPQGPSPRGLAGTKPTIVLVHGAWADTSTWDNVIAILQQEGLDGRCATQPVAGTYERFGLFGELPQHHLGAIVLVGHTGGR